MWRGSFEMRIFALIVILTAAACSAPQKNEVADTGVLDSRVIMPVGANALESYNRVYARTGTGWVGVFDSANDDIGSAEIVDSEDMLPGILDGGCTVVNVTFDENQNFLSAFCNGEA
jgi:hypothetical protein